MPDGDRFMRQSVGTGRGWGKSYSLALNDSPYLLGQITKACADNFRRLGTDDIRKSVDILTVAFERQSRLDKNNLMASANVFFDLKIEFRRLKAQGDYDLVGVLGRTIESVFNTYKDDCENMSRNKVIEKLGESLTLNIMDSRWLSRVRDGLMEKLGRDQFEQMKWEQDLRAKMIPEGRKMLKNAFKGEDKGEEVKAFRAPASKQKKRATADILSKKLNVLPAQ